LEKLILWEAETALMPRDPAESLKLQIQMLEATKADLASGKAKAWGIATSGMRGYVISELEEQQLFIHLAKYQPYVKFKVESMLDLDECLFCMKEIQKQAAAR